jgi:multidrug efflux pump subunit AcrB
MRYPEHLVSTPEDLAALPVGVAGKIVPFGALLPFKVQERLPAVYRENHQDLIAVKARVATTAKATEAKARRRAAEAIAAWEAKQREADRTVAPTAGSPPSVTIEDAGKDVTDAIKQLGLAILSSIALIFRNYSAQCGSNFWPDRSAT